MKKFLLKNNRILLIFLIAIFLPLFSFGQSTNSVPALFGIRVEFILFALTLFGVAVFHHKTMYVALAGLAAILLFKFIFVPSFNLGEHLFGGAESEGEWRILLNLLGLLFGFAILAKHFEESKIPDKLPDILPDNWTGGLVLLFAIMVLSSFLDNIAAAMIGGTIAIVVYKGKVHIGFLAAIIAASNAGGAGSVVGDTTTTLMWIDGVKPLWVTKGFIASGAAFLIFGVFGALQQQKYAPILKDAPTGVKIYWPKVFLVFFILVMAIVTNWSLDFPALGVWIAILVGAIFIKTPWEEMKNSWMGTVFLMSLVTCASLMPVEDLPPASWKSAFALGFVSAVFDNIPLTKLCLDQGGYDWGMLAFSVGFGGSMIWFGSSAGVALSNKFNEIRNTVQYVKKGWHVTVAYIISFFFMLGIAGWHPHPSHKENVKSKVNATLGNTIQSPAGNNPVK
jgi:Na+/H+ antiporter NhaD/arsenite permease-like protein